jgi:hypothetical protein
LVANEQQRWVQMEEERRREEARMQRVREAGIRGKQNKSSEHFDIISLNYHPTKEGKQLQYKVPHVNVLACWCCAAGSGMSNAEHCCGSGIGHLHCSG